MVASYLFDLSGTIRVSPLAGTVPISGDFVSKASIIESLGLVKKVDVVISLDDDADEIVSLGDLSAVHVLSVRVLTEGAGKLLVSLTHADGTDQVVPVGSFLILSTADSPITALSIQRSQGVAATVHLLLGQKSS